MIPSAGTTGPTIESDDDDDDQVPVGMSDVLRGIAGNAPKGKAKAKTVPKAKAKATATSMPPPAAPSRTSTKRKQLDTTASAVAPEGQPSPKAPKVDQAVIGRAAKRNGKKAKDIADDNLSLDGDVEPMDFTKSISLNEADKQVMDQFENRFKAVKDLGSCPLADSAFKQHLMDKTSSVTAISNELRTKKKSAGRRAGKDADPLYIALGDFQKVLNMFSSLLKCYCG